MCPEPQRPDRHQGRDQPLLGIGRRTRDQPKRTAGPDQAEREGPDGVDPAGIAGSLLHYRGARHQDRERNGHGRQRAEIQNRHAKSQISRLEVEPFQNTLQTKPGFSVKFP
jgi:hypothetical protein